MEVNCSDGFKYALAKTLNLEHDKIICGSWEVDIAGEWTAEATTRDGVKHFKVLEESSF